MAQQIPECEILSETKTKEMLELFRGERTGWVASGQKSIFFPIKFIEQGAHFYNFKARPDDTWVVSYPRTGTTLTQELVWLLSNDLNYKAAQATYLAKRFPFLEFSMFNHSEVTREFLEMNKCDSTKQQLIRDIAKPGYEIVSAMKSPRYIKTHFPFSMLPGLFDVGCKVVYVARNPKDVAVSWYHLNRSIKTQGYIGDFETFLKYFINDLTPWSPFFGHVKEAWEIKDTPNLLFLFYEEMIHDFPKTIKKVAKFLGKTYTDKEIDTLADYLNIKNFRNNAMVNYEEFKACGILREGNFVRKGVIGGWNEDVFTPELEAMADKWIEENLKDSDLRFPVFNDNIDNN